MPFYRFKQMVQYVGAYMIEKNTDPKEKAKQEAEEELKSYDNVKDFLMAKAKENNQDK